MGDSHAALVRTVLVVGVVATAWVVAHDVLTPDAPEESLSPAASRALPDEEPGVPTVATNVTPPSGPARG